MAGKACGGGLRCLSVCLFLCIKFTAKRRIRRLPCDSGSCSLLRQWASETTLDKHFVRFFFIADVARMLTIKTMTNNGVHCTCSSVDRRDMTTGGRHDTLSVPTSAAVAAAAGNSRAIRIRISWQILTECCVCVCVCVPCRLGKQSVMISYDSFPYRVVFCQLFFIGFTCHCHSACDSVSVFFQFVNYFPSVACLAVYFSFFRK